MAYRIDGKRLAQQLNSKTAAQTALYCKKPPCLAVIYVGEDSASQTYIAAKQKALKKAGMVCTLYRFPENTAVETLMNTVASLNESSQIQGILIQMPLPEYIDVYALTALINPVKDVDGFTPVNLGKLLTGSNGFIPCTAQAVMYTLQSAQIPAAGSHAVVIGRSLIAGKPLAALLTHADATVTLCHSKTNNLAHITRQADILITAAGSPSLITGDMIKKGAAVIDVGINRIQDFSTASGYRVVGDADFKSVQEKAGWITPVPGGIGPLTIAMLLKNTLKAALLQSGFPEDVYYDDFKTAL
ncbi:MAG: bifunctional 5,10-methylenetetrahydrofolate dehydrogenase/5,10-methenyltetrahydrofolate cyclohydrolase [Treponema sp.]